MHKGLHKVISIDKLATHTFQLRIERNGLEFKAGQCVNIGVPNTAVNREYSSYSAEGDPELSFLVREVEGGQVSPQLMRLKAGAMVEVDGAYGLFTLPAPEDRSRKYVFIGTGTGIAPFHCFVKSYPWIDYKMIHGSCYAEEAYNRTDYAPERYVHCSSRDTSGDYHGRVTNYLESNPQNPEAYYYLCGNRNMINDVYDILREQGVSGSHIVTETFF